MMHSLLRRVCTNKLFNQYLEKHLNLGAIASLHTTDTKNGLKAKWRAPTLMILKERVDQLKEKGKYPVPQRSKFLEWNHEAELYAFGKRLNENFDASLLLESFTDASHITEEIQRLKDVGVEDPKIDLKSNDELARAGKAIMEDFITKYLRAVCPLLPEEGIGSLVRYLTSDEVLCKVAQGLGFRDLILIRDYPPTTKNFSQSFSAVVACLNMSSGLERCHFFIRDFVIVQLIGKDIWDIWELDDPLALLKNIYTNNGKGTLEPRLMGDIGKNTIEAVFQVGIYDENKKLIGKGYGETIDVAIHVAAYDSLSKLFDQSASRSPMPFFVDDVSTFMSMSPNPSISQWKFTTS